MNKRIDSVLADVGPIVIIGEAAEKLNCPLASKYS